MTFAIMDCYEVDDIVIIFYQSRNKFNQLTYKEVAAKGYIDFKTRLVRNLAGEETVSSATLYINHPRAITHRDFIRYNGVKYSVISMVEQKDFSPNHQEVILA